METNRNVFQLWMENSKVLPFKVRRFSWHPTTFFEVKRVEAKWDYYKRTGKLYGSAYGYMYVRGELVDKDIQLSCAGCYQWEIWIDVS
jgi:hypothetical protein